MSNLNPFANLENPAQGVLAGGISAPNSDEIARRIVAAQLNAQQQQPANEPPLWLEMMRMRHTDTVRPPLVEALVKDCASVANSVGIVNEDLEQTKAYLVKVHEEVNELRKRIDEPISIEEHRSYNATQIVAAQSPPPRAERIYSCDIRELFVQNIIDRDEARRLLNQHCGFDLEK